MDQFFEAELLKNAIAIGDEIIMKAAIDSKGLHWRTVKAITPHDDVETSVNETIHSGVSGILLFYIELYKQTQSKNYLYHINSSAEWLIDYCNKNPLLHGFYAGRMGAVYTLFKVAEIDKKEYYINQAIEIALQFKHIKNTTIPDYNLSNGLAGTILGLLYLHAEIEEDWVLDSIHEGIEHLLQNCKSNGSGFYWDIRFVDEITSSTKPLCSMALGASGIGLLFLNLATYFKNADYYYIAKQAISYEDQYLKSDSKNWPDFRINLNQQNRKKLEKSYKKGNYAKFKSDGNCIDWMHGLIGLGYTRLKAVEAFEYETSFKDLNFFIDNLATENNMLHNYTLATGKAGLGMFLLELSTLKKDKTHLENACKIAREAINKRAANKHYQFGFTCKQEYEDDSLLMGSAGIGYFYLNLLKPGNNILFPYLNKISVPSNHPVYQFKTTQALNTIINAWYPNTLNIINNKNPLDVSNLKANALIDSLTNEIEKSISLSNNKELNDAYTYENNRQKLPKNIASNHCFFMFYRNLELQKNKDLLEQNVKGGLMDQTLQLNQYVTFTKTNQGWMKNSSDQINEARETHIVYTPNGQEYTLSQGQDTILKWFTTPQKVERVYKHFINNNGNTNESEDYLKAFFMNFIKLYMENTTLIAADKWYANSNKKNKIEDIISVL